MLLGNLRIQVVKCKDLEYAKDFSWFTKNNVCNPYVLAALGENAACSKTIFGTRNPSWLRETLFLPIYNVYPSEDDIAMEGYCNSRANCTLKVFNQNSTLRSAGQTLGVMQNAGVLIGMAILDCTKVVTGQVAFMDQWVALYSSEDCIRSVQKKKPQKRFGDLHVLVHYEPIGMDPMVGDVVEMHGFGHHPLNILPPLGSFTLCIEAVKGNYVLGSYVRKNSPKLRIRLHRNTVFVIKRSTISSKLHAIVLKPVRILSATPWGAAIVSLLTPYVRLGSAMIAPLLLACKGICVGVYRAIRGAMRAMLQI